ncbi:toxin glutamine deamidase domain-containing protein [Microbispora sp. NPDC049125]|uniref:toxin glutamine deamidase domain-containing protein n=1 Tax=Microbispora sp. NPDC049125 TaxID=3154929 RepID=UPI003465BCA6
MQEAGTVHETGLSPVQETASASEAAEETASAAVPHVLAAAQVRGASSGGSGVWPVQEAALAPEVAQETASAVVGSAQPVSSVLEAAPAAAAQDVPKVADVSAVQDEVRAPVHDVASASPVSPVPETRPADEDGRPEPSLLGPRFPQGRQGAPLLGARFPQGLEGHPGPEGGRVPPGHDIRPVVAEGTGSLEVLEADKSVGLWAFVDDEVDRDWLDGPGRPPRLEDTRPYGRPGGLAEADAETRGSLLQAVGGRFPDPRGTWIRLINGEGPTEDPFRSNNAVDCALAVMSTWHGEPVAAARRQPEYDLAGRPLLTGETGGVARAEEWLGHRFEYVGHGRRAYVAIAQRLIFGGHGAATVLITRWPGGGSHAWNAVNCRGEVLWIDAQRGHMAVEPPYEDVTGVFAVVIDRQGQRL